MTARLQVVLQTIDRHSDFADKQAAGLHSGIYLWSRREGPNVSPRDFLEYVGVVKPRDKDPWAPWWLNIVLGLAILSSTPLLLAFGAGRGVLWLTLPVGVLSLGVGVIRRIRGPS